MCVAKHFSIAQARCHPDRVSDDSYCLVPGFTLTVCSGDKEVDESDGPQEYILLVAIDWFRGEPDNMTSTGR